MTSVTVVGAGLAGSEAAWQLAQRGIQVRLYEMRPQVTTPAHETGHFAELVCSNSLGSVLETSAGGVLKMELERLDSLVIRTAKEHRVPAGGALAVDRELFAQAVTERLQNHPKIEIINEECTAIPEGVAVIATGPLTSPRLTEALKEITRSENLYFYDAAAPIVLGESVDYDKGFWGARYGKGTADYFNCPLTKEEYEEFVEALVTAEEAPLHEGDLGEEDLTVFEGCMPIEVMARRGKDALRYGPFKPVGLTDPEGKRPYAVLQLRLENTEATLFNLVGCQTRLKWGEQNRVFQLIPALRSAEFVRYGVMHRNTFINSPRLLKATTQFVDYPRILVAGQLSGVEGYVESAASGLIAGINAARLYEGKEALSPPRESAIGSLLHYISQADPQTFQPMNITFGLMPSMETKDKKEKRAQLAKQAIKAVKLWKQGIE